MRLGRSVCAAAAIAAAVPAYGQSLGELARQEEARRAATTEKKAVKTLSNADLRPQDIIGTSTAGAHFPTCARSDACLRMTG